jgi:hypothetical protein
VSDPDHTISSDGTLVFSTMKNLEFLKQCDLYLVYDKFKSSPCLFDQLFVIHGYKNNNIQCRPDAFHLYSTDPEFNLMLRHLVALAFVPQVDVVTTFDELIEEEFFVNNEALLADFIHYFEHTWVGSFGRGRRSRIRMALLFKVDLWN